MNVHLDAMWEIGSAAGSRWQTAANRGTHSHHNHTTTQHHTASHPHYCTPTSHPHHIHITTNMMAEGMACYRGCPRLPAATFGSFADEHPHHIRLSLKPTGNLFTKSKCTKQAVPMSVGSCCAMARGPRLIKRNKHKIKGKA